jgi:hypothetical protein
VEKNIRLTKDEAAFLQKPINCKRAGGFQGLLLNLQGRLFQTEGHRQRWFLRLDRTVAARIIRYAETTKGGYGQRLRPLAEKARPVAADMTLSQQALPFGS